MRKIILGIALVSLAVGCKNNDNKEISDAATAAAPSGACASACESACDSAAKAECSAAKESECQGEAKTCPVSGQKVEN